MEAIKKKMQAMKLEKDNAADRADVAEQQSKEAVLRAEKVRLHHRRERKKERPTNKRTTKETSFTIVDRSEQLCSPPPPPMSDFSVPSQSSWIHPPQG